MSRFVSSCLALLPLLLFTAALQPWTAHAFFASTSLVRRQKNMQQQQQQQQPCIISRRIHLALSDGEPDDDDEFQDDDDDEDDVDCPMPHQRKLILIISDSTGATAKSSLRSLLKQFDSYDTDGFTDVCDLETKTFSFIRTQEAVADIVERQLGNGGAVVNQGGGLQPGRQRSPENVMVVYTFADPALRAATTQMCRVANLAYIDMLGGLFDVMAQFLQQAPAGLPNYMSSRKRKRNSNLVFSASYIRRIQAVEYTLQADDGRAPWLLPDADVILVGVSRTGKTPLSVVLSHTMGLRVANVPLILEVPPPAQLLDSTTIDHQRVFCLTLAPQILGKIRPKSPQKGKRSVKQQHMQSMANEGTLDKESATAMARQALMASKQKTGLGAGTVDHPIAVASPKNAANNPPSN